MTPQFYMLVGLPYSGKSVHAERLKDRYNAVIHSSDAIRASLLGDEQAQNQNEKVFEELHRRVMQDLKAGKNVVYDATNISYKRRMHVLQMLDRIKCSKTCMFMATPFDVCVQRSKFRERVVPYEVLERMYLQMWIPHRYEGWDTVLLVYPDKSVRRSVSDLFNGEHGLNTMEQDNPNHTFTIGHHCLATYGIVSGGSQELQEAALLHDIGKSFTKSFINSKGETTEVAHYYEHHHVSAYDSLFYTNPELDQLHIAAIIQWHMRPYEIERSNNKSCLKDKLKKLVGSDIYRDIYSLHEADGRAK